MLWTSWIFAYLAIGLCAGFVAGLLGIGGGALLVPLLAILFEAQRFPADHVLHLALGTSMAAIIFTAISSARAHDKHGAVLWAVVLRIVPGILLGTVLGTLLAARISTRALAIFFAFFILYVAVQMFLNFKPKPSRELPAAAGMIAAGTLIGGLSSLVAIGGGILTVPFLSWCNVKAHEAIGTSAAIGVPVAVGGTIGYVWNGIHATGLPAGALGFVHLPAMLFLVAASVLTAPLGARLAHRLQVDLLKRLFGILLVLLAAKMLHGLFWKA